MDRDETPTVTVTATPYHLEWESNTRLSIHYVGEITAEVICCSYANFENFKVTSLELKKI